MYAKMTPAVTGATAATAILVQESGPATGHSPRSAVSVYLELGKARLTSLVLFTTFVGYMLADRGSLRWDALLLTLIGTGLAALGANALNQCLEADRDARMLRTRRRPLASGTLSPARALAFALSASLAGPLILSTFVNPLSGGLALVTIAIYTLLYTPLKTRTPLNTLVGAVVGAIPPMIGWVAADARLAVGAWILAGILFLWQIPHFLALAWMYRDDYARGGYRMLPVIDASGNLTCCVLVAYTLVLLPLAWTATLAGLAGWTYAIGSLVLGLGFAWTGLRLRQDRTITSARRVFLASVAYLPLLLGLMLIDRHPRPDPAGRPLTIAAASSILRSDNLARGDASTAHAVYPESSRGVQD
jgi:protoheme IX farnesyltransferase